MNYRLSLFALFVAFFAATEANTSGFISRPDNTHIYYKLSGEGDTTLVLLHGYGVESSIWNKHVAEFEKNYQVLAIDHRGHGKSSKPHTQYTLDVFADDLHAVLTELSIQKPILLGWSLGGTIAQYYVHKYKDSLSKLILVCTSPCFVAHEGYPFGVTSQALQDGADQVRKDPDAHYKALVAINSNNQAGTQEGKRNKAGLLAMLHKNDPEVLALIGEYYAHRAPSLVPYLKDITIPTLVITGGLDAGVPPGASFYMYTHIPKASLSICPSHGHSLPITNFEWFIKMVTQFIDT